MVINLTEAELQTIAHALSTARQTYEECEQSFGPDSRFAQGPLAAQFKRQQEECLAVLEKLEELT